jgi:hypothetical protein
MPISQATVESLKVLGIDPEKLIEAVKSETETDVAIPEGEFYTSDQITARDEAKIGEGKKLGEREGETKGKELAAKEMKKAFGVDVEGKDLSKLVEAVKTQLSKGDDGLKEQVKILQRTIEEKESALAQEKANAEKAAFDASLLSELPSNRSNLLSDAEYLTVIKANLEFTPEGVKKSGEILRDTKTANPIQRKDAITSFFQERKWVQEAQPQPTGRGGATTTVSNKPSNKKEAIKQWEAEGKGVGTAEFQNYIVSLVKENKDFDLSDN